MLTFEPVTELLTALRGQELSADVDPSELNTPCVWVTVDTITTRSLAALERLEVSVYLIVGDQDHMRAMESLAALYNLAAAVITPDGPVRPTAVVLPSDPTPLPALRVPVYLYETE
jgi:hypothetical protein